MLRDIAILAALIAILVAVTRALSGPPLSPLQARILAVAQSQVGYQTDPSNSYCNRFSAYWYAGSDCGNGNYSEEWCADFAAWVWKQAGAEVTYELAPGYLNSSAASFYEWGVDHGTWHPVGSHYQPRTGDVAVYGLNAAADTAAHVAIVTGPGASDDAPDVINGDGDRTGFSVVEAENNEAYADVRGGGALSGYVSPSEPAPGT
ncbi:MAG: CHAP domain-containing protein [Acidimicrobiales bacterium]